MQHVLALLPNGHHPADVVLFILPAGILPLLALRRRGSAVAS